MSLSETKTYRISSDISEFSDLKTLIEQSKYIDTSLINGLRRIIISDIKTLAFEYNPIPQEIDYIIFKKNTSDMNNDFIGHRIGLLPVNISIIKFLLMIYKIMIGHTNQFDELSKGELDSNVFSTLQTNLKINNDENMELIHQLIFYIDITANNDLQEITTFDIQLRFQNTSIKIEDYITKIKQYEPLLEFYKAQNGLNQPELNLDNLSERNFIKLIFPIFVSKEKQEYGILLAKIKKFNTVQCEFKLNAGTGNDHSRWNVVAPCTYSFVVDDELVTNKLNNLLEKNNLTVDDLTTTLKKYDIDSKPLIKFTNERYNDIASFNLVNKLIIEKNTLFDKISNLPADTLDYFKNFIEDRDKLINNFNKCDRERCYLGREEHNIYKKEFDFIIGENGFYNSDKILKKGFKKLKNTVLSFINRIIYIQNDSTLYPIIDNDIQIDLSTKIINGIDITYMNGDHTLGNIINSYIYYYYYTDNIVDFISYKMIHPLKSTLIITIGFKENITDLPLNTLSIFNNLNTIFKNMDITEFY